ncbi:MAG: SRPBCC domain-containing protein [Chitinophagaceae bacterium]
MRTTTINQFKVSQGYKFCPEIIFDAWVDPEMIPKWLFVGPTSEIINIEIDPVAGGMFSILELERNNGEHIEHFGKYKKVAHPRNLEFTLSVSKHFKGETFISIEIIPQPGGCHLQLTQTGVPPGTTEKNWRDMLAHLNSVLKEMAKKTL